MPQDSGNDCQGGPSLQQMGGHRMTEEMGVDPFGDACGPRIFVEGVVNHLCLHHLPFPGHKKVGDIRCPELVEGGVWSKERWAEASEIFLDRRGGRRPHRDHAIFISLSPLNEGKTAGEIDILHFQTEDLPQPEAAGIEKLQDRPVAQREGTLS